MGKEHGYIGLPLRMSFLLKGFVDGVHDKSAKTLFKWTETLGSSYNNGQIAWVRREIAKWAEMIDAKSGVAVAAHKLKSRWFMAGDRHKFWEIEFEFMIPGHLNLSAFHPSLAKGFSGFFKKFLAEELLRRFPFPFAGKRSYEIPFCGGITDMLAFKATWKSEPWLGNARKIILGEEFRLRLDKLLAEKYLAKLILVKDMGEGEPGRRRYEFQILIFFKWTGDVSCETRDDLRKDIVKLTEEMGATREAYKNDGSVDYKYVVFDIHWD